MSKSLGNFHTLRDVLEKGYSGREVRYALIRVHYRAPLNFTWEGMEEARQALARIDEWLRRVREAARGGELQSNRAVAIEDDRFAGALDGDLNISAALGHLFEQIRESNRELDGGIDSARALAWLTWWQRINQVLALEAEQKELPEEIVRMTEERRHARLARDWQKSDELRDALQARGWEVRDTKDGQVVTRRAGA
jgi:cysteinyl-tRNA synthetase